jgi:hypothetical protein
MFNLSLNEIYEYNVKVVPNLNSESLLKTLNYNKRDLNLAVKEFHKSGEEIHQNVNEIRKSLKKRSKKYIISKDFNEGNLYSIGANIEFEENSYNHIMLPMGDFQEKPNAKIIFRYWKRSKNFKNKFNQLIVALRSNKISFEYEIFKEKNINKIRFEVTDPRDNERFWYTIKLWAKH